MRMTRKVEAQAISWPSDLAARAPDHAGLHLVGEGRFVARGDVTVDALVGPLVRLRVHLRAGSSAKGLSAR